MERLRRAREPNSRWILVALALPEQLGQPRDVDGDAPRLVLRQHFRLQRLRLVLSRADVRKLLPVGVSTT
jgi:hypothetical protein